MALVDTLKNLGMDSSLAGRAKLAVDNGLVKNTNEYVALANAGNNGDINIKLEGLYSKPAPTATPSATVTPTATVAPTTSTVKDIASANAYINGNQVADQAGAAKTSDVPVRSSTQSYQEIFNGLKSTLGINNTAQPAAPNFESSYSSLLGTYGVTDLEGKLNALKDEENTIRDSFTAQKTAENGKTVPMNVIEGRVSQEQGVANDKLNTNLRLQENITNQLKTKYDVVNNIMNLKKLDYSTASDNYNTQLSQNLQLFNVVKGISDAQKSEEEKQTDNARANLQIMYNAIQSGGLSIPNLSSDQKLQITKLEVQSGLPTGFYENFQSKNPKADIITSTTRETNGSKYVDVISRDTATGALKTTSMYVGKVDASSGGKLSDSEVLKNKASKVASQLSARTGADGYIAPEDYKLARKAWVDDGNLATDFDTRFAKTYVNPESYDVVGVSESALK